MIISISTQELVDPQQIGWITYKEGDAALRVKVIRTEKGKRPFLSHCTAYSRGIVVDVVEYEDSRTWRDKSQILLKAFQDYVGNDYYFKATPLRHSGAEPIGKRR